MNKYLLAILVLVLTLVGQNGGSFAEIQGQGTSRCLDQKQHMRLSGLTDAAWLKSWLSCGRRAMIAAFIENLLASASNSPALNEKRLRAPTLERGGSHVTSGSAVQVSHRAQA